MQRVRHKVVENGWELIPWDGNPELGLFCWRKRFGRGHVSVGVGAFTSIVYSYGANSDDSISSTRWRPDRPLTEAEAMALVDAAKGKHEPHADRRPNLGTPRQGDDIRLPESS
jgi:hypothetical protein